MERTDAFRVPEGLSRPEQQWWLSMAAEVAELKEHALTLERSGRMDQKAAQRARDDYGRLRAEYRLRHRRKPEWAVDMIFKDLAVAKECVSDDQWYSRQAVEKFSGSQALLQRATVLTAEMTMFLRRRTEETLARIPGQREGQ